MEGVSAATSPSLAVSDINAMAYQTAGTSATRESILSNVIASVSSRVLPSSLVLPEIPDLPASLFIPPSTSALSYVTSSVSCASYGLGNTATASSGMQDGAISGAGTSVDTSSLHRNLHDMKQQTTREANTLQSLQSQLSAREHEMDRLRAELEQHEQNQRESLHQVQQRGPTPPNGLYAAPLTGGGDIPRSVTMTTQATGTRGVEFALQQHREQADELKIKLRMTTELCAKQDAYYRDVIQELEDRLRETVEGRDQILSLRESEAANQLNLIRQLEATLRQQQQIYAEKDEAINSLEKAVQHLEGDKSRCISVINKLQLVLQEQEVKRGLLHGNYPLQPLQDISSQMADSLVQGLQKCLFDDENEKHQHKSQLGRVKQELENTKRELQSKVEQLQKDYESRIASLTQDHAHALDIAASRSASSREDLVKQQYQMELIKQQHVTEVSAMDDKMASLRLDLEKATRTRDEMSKELETKSAEFQRTSRDVQVELTLLREEKVKLLASASREQANSLLLQEKLVSSEQELGATRQRVQELSEEKKILQYASTEEIRKLRSENDEARTLLLQKEQDVLQQAEFEIQNATKEEQEKSNSRLNIILVELNKLNVQVAQLTSDLEAKNAELGGLQDEYNKIKDSVQQREKEIGMLREEKIDLATRFDVKVKENTHLKEELTSKTKFSEEKVRELENMESRNGKLETQLEERERMIAGFKEQGANLAEVLERNNQTGDSLQRERQELITKIQEQVREVEEMKRHREILAKKLKAKDKRAKELEEELQKLQRTVTVRGEELAALTDDRDTVLSELKARQMEVGGLREERDTLNAILEGKEGEREKEITKLLSRLKGSEQDLALTKKLLKAKGEMSGKAVIVAETMQRQVTEKRGELDALHNKIHWLQESLNTAVKDKRYFESKSQTLSADLAEVLQQRDHYRFQSQQIKEDCEGFRKQAKHLEQALEKAAIKHADNQAEIEKLGQENARLKLKHSLEIKELERHQKTSVKVDAATVAEILTRVNAGLRLPLLGGQPGYNGTIALAQKPAVMAQPITLQNVNTPDQHVTPQEPITTQTVDNTPAPQASVENPPPATADPNDLKSLLQDVRTLVSSFQAQTTHASITATPAMSSGHRIPTTDVKVAQREAHRPPKHHGTQRRAHKGDPAEKPYSGGAKVRLNMVPTYENQQDEDSFYESESESEFDKQIDLTRESMENFRPPLGSSSPKPDRLGSLDYTPSLDGYYRPDSPQGLDDSDVTSLLFSRLSDAASVTSDVPLPVYVSKGRKTGSSAPDATGQRSSTRQIRRDADRQSDKENKWGRERKTVTRDRQTNTRSGPSSKSSDSPPSYQRAEMILKSLAQTGSQLTRKNREIENLLSEQDRRIKKCRENEHDIQTLFR